MQVPEGRPPNVSPARKGWDIDLFVFSASNQLYFKPPDKAVILSEALRRSIANRGLYGAESKDPGDACWQMLLGAFRPQTTTEDKKVTNSERSRGICGSTDLSWKHGISSRQRIVISTGAYPDFLPRCTGNDRVCGFQYGKPHEVHQRHQYQQEIRGSAVERSAGSFSGFSQTPFSPCALQSPSRQERSMERRSAATRYAFPAKPTHDAIS
jgi:hypothetical protein